MLPRPPQHDPGPKINTSDPRYEQPGVEDRQTQLESLLDSVWKAEADWRLDDRIDLAMRRRQPDRPEGSR